MSHMRTLAALAFAFLLGTLATALISGCQQASKPTTPVNSSNTTVTEPVGSTDVLPRGSDPATQVIDSEPTPPADQYPAKSDATSSAPAGSEKKDAASETPSADKKAEAKSGDAAAPASTSDADVKKDADMKKDAAAKKDAGAKSEADAKPAGEPAAPKSDDSASNDAPKKEKDSAAAKVAANVKPDGKPAAGTAAIDKSANPKLSPGDWPQWGGTGYRNNTPVAENIPTEWEIGEIDRKTGEWNKDGSKNIRWVSRLGSQTYGNPVVADGRVYVGSNNTGGYLNRYPPEVDLGVLLCFDEKDGKFLWQDSSEKLPTGRVHDWPLQGICSAPYVEGTKVWYVTSRGEVVCLDAEGFYDNEDDGEVKNTQGRLFDVVQNEDAEKDKLAGFVAALNEGKIAPEFAAQFAERGLELPANASVKAETGGKKWTIQAKVGETDRTMQVMLVGNAPTQRLNVFKTITPADKQEADRIWVLDMMKELRVSQHNMCSCSITALGDLLFVNTSNGVDETHINIPQLSAPSFICVDKNTGEVYWTNNSPGENILHGQWSSPAVAVLGGVPQVIFGGGDGWLYSFKADKGKDGKPELLWEFDANPKETKYSVDARSTRNHIIGTPVIYDGLVYIGVGEDPEHGEGEGHFWCIDPTKRGDVSPQLAVSVDDRTKILPKRRLQAVNAEAGEVAIDNPNSAVVWHFDKYDSNGDGKIDFEETMHRTCGTAAIKNDLVFVADFSGLFHCLDAKTGKLNWTYDMLAASWASPLVADDKVFITDEDGDVAIFNVSAEQHDPIVETNMENSIYTTPVVANETLFIANKTHLFAIAAEKAGE